MRIAVYGGSFDPPHKGHVAAVTAAQRQLRADKVLIIPDCKAPHKVMPAEGATPEQRMELCRRAFAAVPGAELSDIEIRRGGKSYTHETLKQLMQLYPGAELILLVGTDMIASFTRWVEFQWILEHVTLAVFPRLPGDETVIDHHAQALRRDYGAQVERVVMDVVPAASTDVRALLKQRQGREWLEEESYGYIVRHRLYGAKPDYDWLREKAYAMLKAKRIPHVRGCEEEARRLAERWGADVEQAAEAAILHDITKKLELPEQLLLCEKYGIITDNLEKRSSKLLHAKTGAAVARADFGVDEDVYNAIRWHTTGKADMGTLEKVIYMADYMEPTRDFEGVEELRRLAYEDLDKAMIRGFEMSLEDLKRYRVRPHRNTLNALAWYQRGKGHASEGK